MDTKIYNALEVPEEIYKLFEVIPDQKKRSGNSNGSRAQKWVYKDIICAFDIETSILPTKYNMKEQPQAFMYIWQFQLGEIATVIGRTWDEFEWFTSQLMGLMKKSERLMVFVHNLSYEFQWLKSVFKFNSEDVFALDNRKVAKAQYLNLEFRCSYIHSNMSLAEYLNKMGAEHAKMIGDLDYSITRWPWTELTDEELRYCINDVLGLVEAIKIDMESEDDTFYTFPLTSTGYVRRDVKKAMRTVSYNYVKEKLPSFRVYTLLREAFRGGNTHANRYYSNGIITPGAHSADRSSSYPDVICNCPMPVKPFEPIIDLSFDYIMDLIYGRDKALILRVGFVGLKLRDPYWGAPYIPRDKCRNVVKAIYDNGRILSAEYLEMTITDIDLKIIVDEYKFENMRISEGYHSTYGFLPRPIIDTTIQYYLNKTQLKNVEGQEVYYGKQKARLNAIYGLMAQDPVKASLIFNGIDFDTDLSKTPEQLLEEHDKNAFLCYQWGVWTTAWARYRLEEGIRCIDFEHGGDFLYCDTDSVKYVGPADFSKFNKQREKDSIRSGAYATDPKGITHYMGVFEQEDDMKEFATMGAKKYCYITYDNELHITIAGVAKKAGAKELLEYEGIRSFKPGFKFKKAGGLKATYNDKSDFYVTPDPKHCVHIISNVALTPSEYTLGVTEEYERLLKHPEIFIQLYEPLYRK